MYYDRLKQNPLKDYRDLRQALYDTVKPYFSYMSPGCSRIEAGLSAATFNNKAVQLEGFARLLWGVVPYLAGRFHAQTETSEECALRDAAEREITRSSETAAELTFSDVVIKGITNGVDPEHEEFWGVPGDYDQLLVEMAVFGYALLLIPEIAWEPLSLRTKQNFAEWLSYINYRQIPDCNWIFFRILVNCGLKRVGAEGFDQGILNDSLRQVDEFYLSDFEDGWYNDGNPSQRRARDYYIPWAMHYYGLIFTGCCEDMYPEYVAKFRQRARLFAHEFSLWFAEDGAALPYGRSLTYRFAQSAFWGALPFGASEAEDWSAAKGLLLRNLRWWFGQAAYTETGRLTVGYTYPNQYMAERYNSPNSPLWALKAFIPLALPETHPFWQSQESAAEEGRASQKNYYFQKNSGFCICPEKTAGHLYALNNGQWTPGVPNEHLHMAEKYAKFAYSVSFGFNVVTDTYGLDKLAGDNMLLLSDGNEHYRYRTESSFHEVTETYIYSKWKPFTDVHVETWLAPLEGGRWHLRVHKLVSARRLKAAEGGFPLPYGDDFYPLPEDNERNSTGYSRVVTRQGCSRIVDFSRARAGRLVFSSPNSNIVHPRVVVPTLLSEHAHGEFYLGCLVQAEPEPDTKPDAPPLKAALAILPDSITQNFIRDGE